MASESEKRFHAALKKLENAANSFRAKCEAGHVASDEEKEALLAQNAILQDGLDRLKVDYEQMEAALVDLKAQVESSQKSPQGNQGPQGDGAGQTDLVTAERDSLREELTMVQRDYQTLEDSFTALKSQYAAFQDEEAGFAEAMSSSGAGVVSEREANELREERDSLRMELEKIKDEYVRQLAENELLQAEAAGVETVRQKLKDNLDGTISRLEAMQ